MKMMRAPLFALLQLSQSVEFITKRHYIDVLKEGVTKYLQFESDGLYEELGVDNKMKGWLHLLFDKCLENELMDVKTVNFPEVVDATSINNEVYVYAGYMKPGHQ